ncbi:MAG: FHA domain-containing protein, partial [Hyphomicrobium sp.]
MKETTNSQPAAKAGRFLGTLKDALAAAGRDDVQSGEKTKAAPDAVTQPIAKFEEPTQKPT